MDKALRSLTIAQLQNILSSRGLETKGRKSELTKRLFLNLTDEGTSVWSFLEEFFGDQSGSEDEQSGEDEVLKTTEEIVIPEIVTEVNNTSSHSSSSFDNMHLMFSLPPLKFDSFNGNPADYPRFISQYNEIINKTNLSDYQKLTRLIQFLDGPPKEAIRCLEGMPGGLHEALSILKERYGAPYLIVHSTIESITSVKQINNNDKIALRSFSDKLRCSLYSLKSLNQLREVNTSHMIKIVSRLPYDDQVRWRDYASAMRPKSPSFEQLVCFVERRANALTEPIYGNICKAKDIKLDKNVKNFNTIINERTYFCAMCKNNHRLMDCENFLKLSINERKAFIAKSNLCSNCFGRNHKVISCRSKISCLKNNCGKRHHSLIHEEGTVKSFKTIQSNSFTTEGGPFLQIVPIKVKSYSGKVEEVFALLDTGSESSFISKKVADMLSLKKTQPVKLNVSTLSGSQLINVSYTSLDISAIDSKEDLKLNNIIVIDDLSVKYCKLPTQNEFKQFDHLSSIPTPLTSASSVEIIIGCDVPYAFIAEDYALGPKNQPIGIKTVLGWSIFGSSNTSKNTSCFKTTFHDTSENVYESYLKQIISIDNDFVNSKPEPKQSRHDNEIINFLDKSTTVINNRFVIPMLWNDKKKDLTNNRILAVNSANYLKKRFIKNENYFNKYSTVINSYFEKGFARKVPEHENEFSAWYLPHHGVENAKKPDKLRVVFNAASKHNGLCLNDCLYQGPDLTNNLIGVLCRFRQEPFALAADIENMFHQIRLVDEDRRYVRFVWWTDGIDNPLTNCEMLVHIFGSKCSPCIANYALKRAATDNTLLYPEVVRESIFRNFYVDDFLKSRSCKNDALALFDNVKQLLETRKFNLTKLKSNFDEPFSEADKLNQTSILGIQWDMMTDDFVFQPIDITTPLTKRGILSSTSLLFDPLGFLAPMNIVPKLILQSLWREGYKWDEEISETHKIQWERWCSNLKSLPFIRVPRCLSLKTGALQYQLHAFCDASETAYGTCIYLRCVYANDEAHVSFVFGKAKVSPVKFVTIPRLELQSALLASQIISKLKSELDYEISQTFCWTDSTTTIKSVRNKHLKLSTYVANRVSKILECTNESDWNYVPTHINPADDASRGLSVDQLINSTGRWRYGPQFLRMPMSYWPKSPEAHIKEAEVEHVLKVTNLNTFADNSTYMLNKLVTYFSCFTKLLQSIAWLARYKMYLRNKKKCLTGPLSIEEINNAEVYITTYVQRQYFSKEISNIINKKNVLKSSSMYKLSPFLDKDNALRVGGRLKHSNISYEQKHQLILPKDSHLSFLICTHFHKKTFHTSKESTISATRTKYWIIKVRQIVQKIVNTCIICRKLDAVKCQQLMGDLPMSRVEAYSPPFSKSGIDFFGPILVSSFRRKLKRYGVIFVCLTTKAVHLEICPSLETEDFLNTLLQFACRRGTIKELWSDNGTNLTAANKTLSDASKRWKEENIVKRLKNHDIQWHFIPPYASHMGGLWERAIKSVKRSLMILTNGQTLDEHRLRTMLLLTENMLNDRPLTPASDDPNDFQCLTPNNFLTMRGASLPISLIDCPNRKRWAQIKTMMNDLWKRWIKDYLPLLQKRQKWNTQKRNISEGDLVLISKENSSRCEWPLGRVVKLYPDFQGTVRIVDIKTQSGIFKRPIHRLCLLEQQT